MSKYVDMSFKKVPKKLKNHFKAVCAEEGISMTEKFLQWLATMKPPKSEKEIPDGHQGNS